MSLQTAHLQSPPKPEVKAKARMAASRPYIWGPYCCYQSVVCSMPLWEGNPVGSLEWQWLECSFLSQPLCALYTIPAGKWSEMVCCLHWANCCGHIEMTQLLLSSGLISEWQMMMAFPVWWGFCEVVGELSFPLQLSPEGYLGWKAYPTGDLLPCKSDSYGLSVCVPAKFICRSPSTQCNNSILWWSLWRKVGLGNVMNVMALWRDTRELALFIPVYTKKRSCEYTARR